MFRIYKKDQIFAVKQFAHDDRVVIGNSPEVQIDLGSEVSIIHCLVEKRGQQFFLCDMGSEKGTFKNGHSVMDEQLGNGESFQVGPYSIVLFTGAIGVLKPTDRPTISAQPASVIPLSKPAIKSEVGDLKDYLKAGSGYYIEVMVCWNERILNTYHFLPSGQKTIGINGDIIVPAGSVLKKWKLLSLDSGAFISITPEMKIEVVRDGEVKIIEEYNYKLQQAEVCFIRLDNGMQLVVRYAPKAPAVVFDSPVILGSSELTGILAALIIAILTSLLVTLSKPKAVPDKTEPEIARLAKIVFVPPPVVEVAPVQEVPKEVIVAEETKVVKPTPEPAKPVQKVEVVKAAAPAAQVVPKDPKLKTKMFTAAKQGGAIKTSATAGANAKSKELDMKNTGLLSAFGDSGSRSKLDQAYSGASQLIGDSEKAGASGFNSNRQGEDLGSKIKDTGAGGAGTATQGIGSLKTKGRGGGISQYGSGEGLGEKGGVNISAGGSGETFVGSIDKEAVRRAVKFALPQFKACYEREYRRNTNLAGKVVIKWDIDDRGVANNSQVVKAASTINNQQVEECVRLRMLGLKFPEAPPGTVAEISFPFIFDGPKL